MGKKGTGIRDVIIIGAGASGMMAAITAARRGKSVLILEHKNKPGKKILATGNGKCNFTNAYMEPECFHGDKELISSVLSRFSQKDCLQFFHEIGIYPKNKKDYYYPNSEQALSVVEALTAELSRLHVELVTEEKVTSVIPGKYGFTCQTTAAKYQGKNLIFATGLLASPKLGSDGSAISLVKELGHRFVPILPALCGFYCKGMDFKKVAGVRCDATLALLVDGQMCGQERGELQLTDYGLSGIPMFQLSSKAVRSLHAKKKVQIQLDFLPELDEAALVEELQMRKERMGEYATAAQLLNGLLNHKVNAICLAASGISEEQKKDTLSSHQLAELVRYLKAFPVALLRVREAEYAQVCTGGVRTEEIDTETLESRIWPGLYFVGELLDVDGICGGYNLQWAWSSGYVAGSSVE